MSVVARARWLAAALVLVFAVQCVFFVRANSQAYDEALTLTSGALLLRGGPDINAEHPPLARLVTALPMHLLGWTRDGALTLPPRADGFTFARHYLYEHARGYEALLLAARAPMVIVAIALVALIGAFAWRRFGPRAGLLALFLAALDPNLVAHGSIAGHDGMLAFATAATFFAVSELFAAPSARALVFVGLGVGVALVTKFSGLAIGLVAMTVLLAEAALGGAVPALVIGDGAAPRDRKRALVAAAANALVASALALLVVRVTYAVIGRGFGAFFGGVRAQLAHQDAGHAAFFLGQITRGGSPLYFPVAIAAKMPPLTLGLALVGSTLAVMRAVRARDEARRDVLRHEILPLVLPLVLLFAFLLSVRVNIGARYALPLWPLAIVIASSVVNALPPLGARGALLALLLLGQHAAAAARIAPHDLAFFSDVVGGPERGARLLGDSNIDWGQDLKTLARWQTATRPRRLVLAYFGSAAIAPYGVRYQPAPSGAPHAAEAPPPPYEDDGGRGDYLAVSMMTRAGVYFGDRSVYAWLDGRTPVARLGHSIEVFDITGDADAHRALARLYRRFGRPDLATTEEARVEAR